MLRVQVATDVAGLATSGVPHGNILDDVIIYSSRWILKSVHYYLSSSFGFLFSGISLKSINWFGNVALLPSFRKSFFFFSPVIQTIIYVLL